MAALEGKRIILGVTGSIAAIKAPTIARELAHIGASVTCVMTESAEEFVSSEEMAEATGQPVITSIFQGNHPPAPSYSASLHRRGSLDPAATWHVHLARSADAMLIAPCSASAIGMLRAGIYDNAVMLAAASLPKGTPLVLVPAMDEDMWLQAAVRENLAWLMVHGAHLIEPVTGKLASGLTGMGRMPEPEDIVREFSNIVAQSPRLSTTSNGEGRGTLPLQGKRILITGGPTYEPIDAVRFIGNRSSGKMAAALALEAKRMGAEVTLIMGPTTPFPLLEKEGVIRIDVETAEEMLKAVTIEAQKADIIIMSAAVADFAPEETRSQKLKKGASDTMTLTLRKTPDILAEISRTKRSDQILVGFALEKGIEAEDYARKKLRDKNLDMIVLNNIADEGAGFGYDTNKVTIFTKSGERTALPLISKDQCAREILQKIAALP
ncbi:MAG TPA: bifunctional phosphopantothenoylcysteine decarboxylase/phosphopantothenate--cysteine ligase CoaBC [Candidatus Kapabacteria bacterium]|nr:bifunctional phosphopantothenoylcysteine decarboxylase/phosphopantothenate--cysteine ligase CoaBC [Candidatus Kapabacteria bacterium]